MQAGFTLGESLFLIFLAPVTAKYDEIKSHSRGSNYVLNPSVTGG